MKNLIIVGARGFGRQVYNLARDCNEYRKEFLIKGFLDDKSDMLNPYSDYPPIISSVEDYIIQDDDIFVVALGDVKYKRKYIELIKDKGGEFITLIHPSTKINCNVVIGEGTIILANCIIDCDSNIGDFVTIQYMSVVGHDVKIGDFCMLDCYSFCGGFVELGEMVTLHTGAKISPKKKIGYKSIIGIGSIVIYDIKENINVFGNPAKPIIVPSNK